MNRILIIVILFSLCFSATAEAAGKKKIKKPQVEVNELTPEELYFEEMLPNTAKIMFIDSVVVNKDEFLSAIPFSNDMGRMIESQGSVGYTNEFDNTEVFAHGDSNKGRYLYLAHRYGKEWNNAQQLSELKGNFSWVDYPFLLANGVTLYYSARGGEETFGNMDLYKTNYDNEDSRFYEPANMGLPFNSPANDYFMAISDMDNLGWLVTDRRQPEGKVCIYTFEPTENRVTFTEEVDSIALCSYAKISSISDTWKFGNHEAAMKRLNDMRERIMKRPASESVYFIVNDRTVYTSLSQFRSPESRELYNTIVAMRKKYDQNKKILETTRKSYAKTPNQKRYTMLQQLQQLEKEQSVLSKKIAEDEKFLRNKENLK